MGKQTKPITIESGQIAPEFANFKGTLLVVECDDVVDCRTANKMTEKWFEKNYKGSYEIITESDLKHKSFSDTAKKYRFMVQLDNTNHFSGNNTYVTSVESWFVMTDRMLNKKYETGGVTGFAYLLKRYTDALETIRYKE